MRLLMISLMIVTATIFPALIPNVYAGAALMQAQRAKQMKAQREAQAQQLAAQQYQQQQSQQGAEVDAAKEQAQAQEIMMAQMQRMISNYVFQRQMQDVEQALAMRYLQEELQRRMAEAQIQQIQQVSASMMNDAVAAAVTRAKVDRSLAASDPTAAKQYLEMRNDAIRRYGNQTSEVNAYMSSKNPAKRKAPDDTIQQVVDSTRLYQKLDNNAQAWTLLIENQDKVMVVNEYIERFRRENVKIAQPPVFYAKMIDDITLQNPVLLNRPFKDVIQLLAVMEYDFDMGMDRDMLAYKVLGEAMYKDNKKRLGR